MFIQTVRAVSFLLFTALAMGTAQAKNVTFDIYHDGSYFRTTTMRAEDYQRTAARLAGTGISLRPHASAEESSKAPGPEGQVQDKEQRRLATEAQEKKWQQEFAAKRAAAERREAEWKQGFEQRRIAAQVQEEKWQQDSEARRDAALERMKQWDREAEQRRIAAEAQMQKWREQFDRLYGAAQQGFDAWKKEYRNLR